MNDGIERKEVGVATLEWTRLIGGFVLERRVTDGACKWSSWHRLNVGIRFQKYNTD